MAVEVNLSRAKFSLAEMNRRMSSTKTVTRAALCTFILCLAAYVAPPALRGGLGALPEVGDAPDYDAIAVQIQKGHGVSVNWDDPDYLAPYLADQSEEYKYLLPRDGAYSNVYRPPLFPTVMALFYRVVGRNFGVIRVINCAFVALAIALAFAIVARAFGVIPGFLFFILFLVDWRPRLYGRMVLTEALTTLLITLMFWCAWRVVKNRSDKWAVLLGIFTALAFLTKTMFIFFVPPIVLLLFVTRPNGESWISRNSFRLSSLVLAAFLVVSVPWMLRNCLVLNRFEPLGTQGGVGLISGYSNRALAEGGIWYNPSEFVAHLPLQGKQGLEAELLLSDYSKAAALQWIWEHPAEVPKLAILKILSEWRPQTFGQMFMLFFAGLGFLLLFSVNWRQALTVLAFPVACTLVVAVTYSDRGRFLVPLVPIITILSALGVWSLLVSLTELRLSRFHLRQE